MMKTLCLFLAAVMLLSLAPSALAENTEAPRSCFLYPLAVAIGGPVLLKAAAK